MVKEKEIRTRNEKICQRKKTGKNIAEQGMVLLENKDNLDGTGCSQHYHSSKCRCER